MKNVWDSTMGWSTGRKTKYGIVGFSLDVRQLKIQANESRNADFSEVFQQSWKFPIPAERTVFEDPFAAENFFLHTCIIYLIIR